LQGFLTRFEMIENFSVQKYKNKFNENKNLRVYTYIAAGIVGLIVVYLAYYQFIFKPAEEKSKDAYWEGLNYAAKDSTDKAIDVLRPVVKKYDGKVGGEMAQFTLARQYMSKGEFKKALKELESVEVEDTYVSAMAVGLQGDCYSEMKDYKKAAAVYLDAAAVSENEMTTPMYLFKAGLCSEKNKDFDKATECYNKIKDDYPQFATQKAIEKYIERSANKTTKK
jgi:tetratricopeptide (TPR) repeat protein